MLSLEYRIGSRNAIIVSKIRKPHNADDFLYTHVEHQVEGSKSNKLLLLKTAAILSNTQTSPRGFHSISVHIQQAQAAHRTS